MRFRKSLMALLAAASVAVSGGAFAQKKEVTFAHQDMLVPLRVLMESGELEKVTGYKINWRMFGGGGDVIKAMASGDVQLGEAGSSPITAAASQGQDIRLFWILDDIADAEALIARNGTGINSVKGSERQEGGNPLRVHRPLSADGRHENGWTGCEERQCDESAPPRDRCRLGAWRH